MIAHPSHRARLCPGALAGVGVAFLPGLALATVLSGLGAKRA